MTLATDNYVRCPICGAECTDHTGNEPCGNCGGIMNACYEQEYVYCLLCESGRKRGDKPIDIPEKLSKQELRLKRIRGGPPRPKTRIGCYTESINYVNLKMEQGSQYCDTCLLREKYPLQKIFEQKCDSIRMAMGAKSIWNTHRHTKIIPELQGDSKDILKKPNSIEFTGDIDEYARKLHDLTTGTISEAEALELELAGNGKLLCDVKKVVDT